MGRPYERTDAVIKQLRQEDNNLSVRAFEQLKDQAQTGATGLSAEVS